MASKYTLEYLKNEYLLLIQEGEIEKAKKVLEEYKREKERKDEFEKPTSSLASFQKRPE